MVGFIGVMWQPMALNVARAGTPLIVWNRTSHKCEPLRAFGAHVATTPAEVFANARIVIFMLSDEDTMDTVLQRGTFSFEVNVSRHVIVNAGTMSPQYSQALDAAIREAGGWYVESPVSGSRIPAERGQLIAMLAGEPHAVEEVRQLLGPL